MKKVKKEKQKDLYASDCEVIELYKNKVVVKVSEKENLVAKKIGILKKDSKVNIYKRETVGRFEEIMIYISPIYYLFLAVVFGFLFHNDLYHYLLILGMTVVGFIQLFVLRALVKRLPPNYYIAVNQDVETD